MVNWVLFVEIIIRFAALVPYTAVSLNHLVEYAASFPSEPRRHSAERNSFLFTFWNTYAFRFSDVRRHGFACQAAPIKIYGTCSSRVLSKVQQLASVEQR